MYIHPESAYALVYNPELNCLQRKKNIPMKQKTKDHELNFHMSKMPGYYEKMDLSKWEYVEEIGYLSFIEYDEDQACICSQPNCRQMFFLRHILTGVTVRLGSQCILKYNPQEREKLEKIKRDSKKKNCKRAECSNKIHKGTKVGKAGFCSKNCYIEERDKNKSEKEKEMDKKEKKERIEYEERKIKEQIEKDEKKKKEKIEEVGTWTILFGKYKGQTFNEIFEKDEKYLKWCYEKCERLNKRIRQWIEYKWSV